jgi:protein-S-isoprenylcysteine O-methyltransferase Ste14
LRYFLPIYLAVYVFTAFLWRSYRVWKRTGINPVVFKRGDNAHDYIGRVFKLQFAVLVVVVIIYSFFPWAYQYLLPISWLELKWIQWIGITLLFVSLAWTVMAQAEMGESWRIGIDTEHKTPLVQTGVFKLSRNPIFLGLILTLCGVFLAIPNALTLLSLVLGIVVINIQVRLEEEYLMNSHSDDYLLYRRQVRRWL